MKAKVAGSKVETDCNGVRVLNYWVFSLVFFLIAQFLFFP